LTRFSGCFIIEPRLELRAKQVRRREMNYTKGEWIAKRIQTSECEVWAGKLIVAICPFQTPISGDERKTNAHLIAAAPDMYEALKRLIKMMPDCGGCIKTEAAILEAQEAIAKAEEVK